MNARQLVTLISYSSGSAEENGGGFMFLQLDFDLRLRKRKAERKGGVFTYRPKFDPAVWPRESIETSNTTLARQ